jgi:hypothetical protein
MPVSKANPRGQTGAALTLQPLPLHGPMISPEAWTTPYPKASSHWHCMWSIWIPNAVASPNYDEDLAAFYQKKFQGIRFAVIVCSDTRSRSFEALLKMGHGDGVHQVLMNLCRTPCI